MSQNLFFSDRGPVPITEARIEGVGVNPLDVRRVDVAIDLTPCQQPLTLRLAIVGPDDGEWSSTAIINNREWMVDKMMHLCRDAEPGAYTLHVGIFDAENLIHHIEKPYTYPNPESG